MKMPAAQREECYRVVLIRRQSGWPRVRTDVCLLQRLPDPHRAQLEQDFLQEQEGGFGKPHLGPTDGREARTAMRLLPSEGEEETLGVAWRGARKRKPEAAWGPRLRAGPMVGLPPPRRRADWQPEARVCLWDCPALGRARQNWSPSTCKSSAMRGAFASSNDSPPMAPGCDPVSQTQISLHRQRRPTCATRNPDPVNTARHQTILIFGSRPKSLARGERQSRDLPFPERTHSIFLSEN